MAYVAGKLAFVVLRPSNLLLLLALLGLCGIWRAGGAGDGADQCRDPGYRRLHPPARGPLADDPAGGSVSAARRSIPRACRRGVFLGGGIVIDVTEARRQPSFGATMERFAAIPQLLRRYPDARLLFTGGSPSGDDPGPTKPPSLPASWRTKACPTAG